jgi:hypothetical protein
MLLGVKLLAAAYGGYSELARGLDVDGPDPFWSDPGAGWATRVG